MSIRSLLSFVKDLFYFLPLPTGTPREWNDVSSVQKERPIVILVSGFGATERTLSVIRKRLIRDGFSVLILALDWKSFSDGVRGLYRMSETLSREVLSLRKSKHYRDSKIFLVAHSAGGLVARHYVQQLGGSHYVNGLVTMATPHSGTWIAGLGLLTHLILKARCLLQMLPKSHFLKSLNKASYPSGFRMVSVYSTTDFLCPETSTQLPPILHQEMDIQSVGLKNLSHGDFLMSKKSYTVVRNFLLGEIGSETELANNIFSAVNTQNIS